MAAKRQAIFTFPSDKVQGKGSWVKVRAMMYGTVKRIRLELADADDEQQLTANEQLVIDHVFDWNWVDDDDQPLPLPKADPDVLTRLTAQEMTFLGQAVGGELLVDEKKASPS